MTDRAIGNNFPVFNLKRIWILIGCPTGQIFAVEKFGPLIGFFLARGKQ